VDDATSLTRDERDIRALMDDFDDLVDRSKSVFPGRILLNRKKAKSLVDALADKLEQASEREGLPPIESFKQAFEAISAFDALVIAGGRGGPSLWRIWFLDVNRKQLVKMLADLRTVLAPFETVTNMLLSADGIPPS
jgi:hypothetical protein